MPKTADYSQLYPDFRAKVQRIEKQMDAWCAKHLPGYTCRLHSGYRSAAEQNKLYQQGRTTKGDIVTYKDGYNSESNHQSRLAADLVAVTPKGSWTWNAPAPFWAYLAHCIRDEGLEAGGDWKMRDLPHVEWPAKDKETYRKARAWKP